MVCAAQLYLAQSSKVEARKQRRAADAKQTFAHALALLDSVDPALKLQAAKLTAAGSQVTTPTIGSNSTGSSSSSCFIGCDFVRMN